jgi:hypothetical protein
MIDFKRSVIDFMDRISLAIPKGLGARTYDIFKWLSIGLVIRFLLMPVFAGGDFTSIMWVSFKLATANQLVFSNDPPAIFFLLGGFYKIILPLFPSAFLGFITSNTAYTPSPFQVYAALEPGINIALFLAKIPFLLVDIFSAFLMLHLFNDETEAFNAFRLWIINPIVLLVSYVYGQFDIFSVFFMILTLFFLKKGKFGLSMLSVGFAGIFKIIGFALLPLVAVCFWKFNHRESLKNRLFRLSLIVVLGLLPLLIIPLVFSGFPQYYESVNFILPKGAQFNGFFGEIYYTRGLVGQPFYSGILTFLIDYSIVIRTQALTLDFVYYIPFIYVVILLGALLERQLSFGKVWKYFVVFLLAYYAFSLFHPQWFLWIQPFLILLAVENYKIFGKLFVLLMPLYFVYTLRWDTILTTSLLAPIIPKALYWPGPLTLMSNAGLPAIEIISLFRTAFSAVCVFMIFYIVKTSFWREQKQLESNASGNSGSQRYPAIT